MKKWYVYEIVNLMGTVEYVGETTNIKNRWRQHKCNANNKYAGKFRNRMDVFMNIVKDFDNKKDAFNYQCQLQKEYGIKTDLDYKIKNTFARGNKHSNETKLKISLTHYGKTLTDETKTKMSLAKKGKTTWNKGIKQSLEHIKKRADSLRGKKYNKIVK